MAISVRMLNKWRKEALEVIEIRKNKGQIALSQLELEIISKRILTLTQELLDQELLRRK